MNRSGTVTNRSMESSAEFRLCKIHGIRIESVGKENLIKRSHSIFMRIKWKNPFVIVAAVSGCLLVGLGIYYMATVDAMNGSLDGSWIWFLGATIAFIALEMYFGHGDERDQNKMEISPDAPEQHEI